MSTLRNVLITYGACVAGMHLVNLIRSVVFDRFFTHNAQDSRSIVVWILDACLVAMLAGLAAGATVQTGNPRRWAALLAVLVGFEVGGSLDWRLVSERPSIALYSLGLSLTAALLAVLAFFVSRDRWLKRDPRAAAA